MQHLSIVVAGATGLIGQSVLEQAIDDKNIEHVYAVSRRLMSIDNQKLTQWIDPKLSLPNVDTLSLAPRVGIIALGTTLKKAGSQEKLYAIDVELVVKVAKQMLALKVEHIIVVSSLGASIKSGLHYLRCKGEMEMALQQLDVNKVTFMQPGPLAGLREEQRADEKWLQRLMKIVSPLMLGPLKNYKLIESRDVARAIIKLATQEPDIRNQRVKRLNRSQMLLLIS